MNEELWKSATEKAKIEWLRTTVIVLQKKCNRLQEQVNSQELSPAEQAAIDKNIEW